MKRSYTEQDPSVLCSGKMQMETCLLFHGLSPPSRHVKYVMYCATVYVKFKYLLLVIRGYLHKYETINHVQTSGFMQ